MLFEISLQVLHILRKLNFFRSSLSLFTKFELLTKTLDTTYELHLIHAFNNIMQNFDCYLITNPFKEERVFSSVSPPPTRLPASPCCWDSICPASLWPASSRLDVSWLINDEIVDDNPFSKS